MDGNPLAWASSWHQDEFGVWVKFTIDGDEGTLIQRMHRISPKRFMMESPQDEKGCYEDEGQVHSVF